MEAHLVFELGSPSGTGLAVLRETHGGIPRQHRGVGFGGRFPVFLGFQAAMVSSVSAASTWASPSATPAEPGRSVRACSKYRRAAA